MKFKVYPISCNNDFASDILKEAEKVAAYNELDARSALRLGLLAEEMLGLLPGITDKYTGEFWIEEENRKYELHISVEVDDVSDSLKKDRRAVLDEKKKSVFTGFVEKIREAVDKIAMNEAEKPENRYYFDEAKTDYKPISQANQIQSYSKIWTVSRHGGDNADALDKSILATLADDILIGVVGNKVDIIIQKQF